MLLWSARGRGPSPADLSGNVSSSPMCKVPASTGAIRSPQPHATCLNHVRVLEADLPIRFKGAYKWREDIPPPLFYFIQQHKHLHVGSGYEDTECSLSWNSRLLKERELTVCGRDP